MNILDSLTPQVLKGEMKLEMACLKYVREQENEQVRTYWQSQSEPKWRICTDDPTGLLPVYASKRPWDLTPTPTQKEFEEAVKSLSDSYLVQTVEIVKA